MIRNNFIYESSKFPLMISKNPNCFNTNASALLYYLHTYYFMNLYFANSSYFFITLFQVEHKANFRDTLSSQLTYLLPISIYSCTTISDLVSAHHSSRTIRCITIRNFNWQTSIACYFYRLLTASFHASIYQVVL